MEKEYHEDKARQQLFGLYNCEDCSPSIGIPRFDENCKKCHGSGIVRSRIIQWHIDRALYVFRLAGVCCTGHSIDIKQFKCGCSEPKTCEKCKNTGIIETRTPRLATAEDIIFMLEQFTSSNPNVTAHFDDGSHPLFVMEQVKKQLSKVSQPFVLPAFRPIICKI